MLEETPKIPRQFIKRKRMTPNMERVMDCLHFKVSWNINAISLKALRNDSTIENIKTTLGRQHVLYEWMIISKYMKLIRRDYVIVAHSNPAFKETT